MKNMVLVNGVETSVENCESQSSFGDLVQHLRLDLGGRSQLITSIKIDGVELNVQNEQDLKHLPLDAIQTVEINTSSQREIIEDTLGALLEFTKSLSKMSTDAAAEADPILFEHAFLKLMDGIETFSQSIEAVKMTQRLYHVQSVKLLEVDLTSILKDLEEARTLKNMNYIREILQTHVTENLAEWADTGIPDLIHAKDN